VESAATATRDFGELERHRRELIAHCYRMLGSPFEAEDAVQDTLLRAWRSIDRFEGRASLRSWLYRIATNVCLDMLDSKQRRARPMDLGEARAPDGPTGEILPESTWIEPVPDALVTSDAGDPAAVAQSRETIRLAFVAALQHLPPRQRAALILCEVLQWKASEVAELLQTSTPAINSALQRARATLDAAKSHDPGRGALSEQDSELLGRYVDAFQRYDMDALTSLIHEDATQSMPPYELWLRGREDIFAWWVGKGAGCRGSRVVPTKTANGSPAFAQYKPREDGREGYEPWALQVLEVADGKIVELTFFLATDTIFPLFGVPSDLIDDAGLDALVRS
jgi:RNA polymerase sigma-70 factor (ECF subfamily)